MRLPDPLEPTQYAGVSDCCAKLVEMNMKLATSSTVNVSRAAKLLIEVANSATVAADSGTSDQNAKKLFVYVPPVHNSRQIQRLSDLFAAISKYGWQVVDIKGDNQLVVGAVYIVENRGQTLDEEKSALCFEKGNFIMAIQAINEALTGDPMISAVTGMQIALLQKLSENKALSMMDMGILEGLTF
jgi:hypothetical protein